MSQDDFLKYVSQQVQRYRKEYSLSEWTVWGLPLELQVAALAIGASVFALIVEKKLAKSG